MRREDCVDLMRNGVQRGIQLAPVFASLLDTYPAAGVTVGFIYYAATGMSDSLTEAGADSTALLHLSLQKAAQCATRP